MSPKISTLIAIVMLALLAVAIWAREARAHETDCSSTTQRAAASEYATLAGMLGIPPNAPIFAKEQEEYVTAVCLHEAISFKAWREER
jgi:hypothetical protein